MAIKASASISLSSVTDVASVTRYYLLQSSTLAKPAVPAANPPAGSWADSEPTYTSGSTNSLYLVDLTVFSDGTWAYSPVSLSSSYEAAKVAYNKATTAQSTADTANSTAQTAKSTADDAYSMSKRIGEYMEIKDDGTHMKAQNTDNEMVLSSQGVQINIGGKGYSQFAARYVQFGNYQIRRTEDGGIAFKMVWATE